jgi:hypothetical protein
MICIVIFYNFLIGVKIAFQASKSKEKQKFVDDTAEVVPEPAPFNELQEAKTKQDCFDKVLTGESLWSSLLLLTFKHISLLFISYTGFIRLMEDDKMIKLPMIIGHGFELFSQTIPLLMIQSLNNKFLNKYYKPLDTGNVKLSVLNILDLIIELALVHYITQQ